MSNATPSAVWQPRHFKRLVRTYKTSMGTSEVITDAGRAYLKPMGSKEGPHPLAAEWAATHLAKWFQLPTFEVALLILKERNCYPLPKGYHALPGPAFASRAEKGRSWGGEAAELARLVNTDAITRLVVFDNWVLNCDRYPPDLNARKPNYANVFLAQTGARRRRALIAMDHTHCFNCGREWTPALAHDRWVKDERLYGLFPQFVPFLLRIEAEASVTRLREMNRDVARAVIPEVPSAWEVSPPAWEAMIEWLRRKPVPRTDESGWPAVVLLS